METRLDREPIRRSRQIALRVTEDEEAMLRREAERRGVGLSAMLRQALDAYLAAGKKRG